MTDAAGLREAFRAGRVLWTLHVGLEAAAEALHQAEVEAAVAAAGEVIEAYPGDQRGASVLVLAHLADGRPVHVVVGVAAVPQRVVTVWRPDVHPELWADDFRSRRRSR